MKTILITVTLLSFFIIVKQSYSSDNCTLKNTKFNICAEAREISNELANILPMKMSQNMSWESVAAIESTIIANVRLHYDRSYLNSLYKQAGLPISYAKDAMKRSASGICNTEEANSFVSLGGKFKYVYSFIDGEQFIVIDIIDCK